MTEQAKVYLFIGLPGYIYLLHGYKSFLLFFLCSRGKPSNRQVYPGVRQRHRVETVDLGNKDKT